MIGGLYYLNGKISEVGVIVEFVLYINMLTFPVSAIGWVASMVQRAAASQKRLNEFLQLEPAIENKAASAEVPSPKGEIVFENVTFTYPHTGITAIRHFNLRIAPGQKVAIIGKTGSGKSTIANLLLRFYEVNEGRVLLDGKEVEHYNLAELRRRISYVPQDVFLFSDTVAANIRFGNDFASEEEVQQVANRAAVANEIALFGQQYLTMVGERGVTLSGGQKQRLSIARALLKPAPVIIFDDCLSAVDSKTEKEILHHLSESLMDKTAIIITHRIFSLLEFDQIILLEEGEILEQGTHQSLMHLNGEYADLYRQQQMDMAGIEP
jgi:ATP-binding cassette subfamily B protein